jgi:F0F1-type ATP synthase membrane subunit b/b'
LILLKKEINEAKKLKIEAENLLDEHKIKEKRNTQYIDELKKQTRKEATEIEERIKKEIELAINRKEANYELIIKQMESNLKEKFTEMKSWLRHLNLLKQELKRIFPRNIMMILLMSL